MKKVLITGIDGFTGRYLSDLLSNSGYQVYGLGSKPVACATEIRSINLMNAAGLNEWLHELQPDWVVHLAAISFVMHGDAEEIYRINVAGTRNLLSALASSPKKPSKVLLASSANIYGNCELGIIPESTQAQPANDYAVSKLAMEYMAKTWFEQLPIIIARPFNYTGVGQSVNFLLPKIVNAFKNKASQLELGNLDVARDFSDVRFVVAAYQALLASELVYETVNVCSGHAQHLHHVITLMQEIAGYDIEINVNPAFVRANEVKTLCGSATKLNSIAPNLPQYSLKETLTWMYQ